MHTTIAATTILFSIFSMLLAEEIPPIVINPTVTDFDSITAVSKKRTFLVGTVQDTSLMRDERGTVGETRIRRRKIAPIVCKPLPALAVKRSVEAMLEDKGIAGNAGTADYTLQILLLDFSLTETRKRVSQTMDAHVSLQITLVGSDSAQDTRKFVVQSRNSRTTIDTSKHAESVMRGALESALREIMSTISK